MHERMRALRKELGLNQTEFGRKIGVSRSVIANIELDRVKPKALLIGHICDIFQVNRRWLAHGGGPMFAARAEREKSFAELLSLYEGLKPEFQEYVLEQIDRLLKLQNMRDQN